jgi:hypothetical protein
LAGGVCLHTPGHVATPEWSVVNGSGVGEHDWQSLGCKGQAHDLPHKMQKWARSLAHHPGEFVSFEVAGDFWASCDGVSGSPSPTRFYPEELLHTILTSKVTVVGAGFIFILFY